MRNRLGHLNRARRFFAAWMVYLVAVLLFLLVPFPARVGAGSSGPERTIRIEASQFQFDPGVIKVQRGDRVTIELVATDVVHGLYLDGYGLELTAEPGQTTRLTFVARRSGTFRFRCSVSCGALHPFMIGKLRVGPNWLLLGGGILALLAVGAGLSLGLRER